MTAAAIRTRTNAPPSSCRKKRRSTAPRTRLRCQPIRRNRGLLKSGARMRCTIGRHGAIAASARGGVPITLASAADVAPSLLAGRCLDQLHVRDRRDRADDVLVPGARRHAERQLDLVAALPDPLAVDAGHL